MEPAIHFAVPFVIIAFMGLKLRWAFISGLIGVIPDLDALFFFHRSVSHSLILPIILLPLLILFWKKRELRYPLLIISIGLASHSLMDFIVGYTPILWPLSDNSFYLLFEWKLVIESHPTLLLEVALLQKSFGGGAFTTFDATILTAEGFVVASLLILFTLKYKGYKLSFIKKVLAPLKNL